MADEVEADKNIITIDWVRHAESVANLYNNKPFDNYITPDLQQKLQKQVQIFQALEYKNVQDMKTTGTFPLINHVYDLMENLYNNHNNREGGTDDNDTELLNACKNPDYSVLDKYTRENILDESNVYVENPGKEMTPVMKVINSIWKIEPGIRDIVNNECIVKLDALKKVDTHNLIPKYIYWLPNMITTNFLFQPTLDYVGMIQAKQLGETYLSKEKHDFIISSPTARTIMTAYIALMHAGGQEVRTITVVPYTNEEENEAQKVLNEDGLHDFTNAAIHPDDIEEVCRLLKTHLDNYYNKSGTLNTNVTINTEKYINLWKKMKDEWAEDTDSLKIKSKNNKYDIRTCSIVKFWAYVKEKNLFNGAKKVLSFCHSWTNDKVRQTAGVNIDELYDKKTCNTVVPNSVKMMAWGANTSVFRHEYDTINSIVVQKIISADDITQIKAIKCEGIAGMDLTANNTENVTIKNLLNSFEKIGVVYIPKKIRKAEWLDVDYITTNDTIMEMHEGSLRYEIARITHGQIRSDLPKREYCTNEQGSYYKEIGTTTWFRKNDNLNPLTNNEKDALTKCTKNVTTTIGGRRTRRRHKKSKKSKKRTHRRKSKKGRKTRTAL